jgi:O-methyltransferase
MKMLVKRWIKGALRSRGLQIIPIRPPQDVREKNPDITDMEWAIWCTVHSYTMTSLERVLATIRATAHVLEHNIPGALVECGVWRGGNAMAMALTLLHYGASRDLYLYDTFEGMTDPTADDISRSGTAAADLLAAAKKYEKPENSLVWACASLQDVQSNVAKTNYPRERINYVKGRVEATIPSLIPAQIALLRLDTDWYESTLHELANLYPKLVVGGILIIDDYGDWQGCRKAVDEYFRKQQVFLNRIDSTGRLVVKSV